MSDKTNKVNFYLLKDGIEETAIFKTPLDEIEKLTIKEGYDLYYNPKEIIVAPWVKSFFKQDLTKSVMVNGEERRFHIFNAASSQAVLIRKIIAAGKETVFAVCFGTGYHMLSKDAYEPRFGLISVLNIVGEDSLRKIDKHDISGTPKFTAEQLSKKGGQMDFGLDIELDILLGVTGSLDKKIPREKRLIEIFGTTISGKSNLNINARFDIDDIDRLLAASLRAFNSKRYAKKGFEWIDKIDLVKKKTEKHDQLLQKLDECMADNDTTAKIWLAVPELVEWQDIKGFYINNEDDELFEDITFDAVKKIVGENLSAQKLLATNIHALHAGGSRAAYSWTAYQCLYAEIELGNESFILINSEWYKLKGDFVQETNAKYQNIISNYSSTIPFKDYESSDENENGYNKNMSGQIENAVCMDAKNISHGGRYNKVEFCDIFDRNNKKIIHIKKYSGSSVLSHLFAQGFVSAQLMLNDSEFRTKVENKINSISNDNYAFGNDLAGYEVVFGIIAKPHSQEIPLFSKINLNNMFTRIQNLQGFNASIAFIANTAALEIEDEDEE